MTTATEPVTYTSTDDTLDLQAYAENSYRDLCFAKVEGGPLPPAAEQLAMLAAVGKSASEFNQDTFTLQRRRDAAAELAEGTGNTGKLKEKINDFIHIQTFSTDADRQAAADALAAELVADGWLEPGQRPEGSQWFALKSRMSRSLRNASQRWREARAYLESTADPDVKRQLESLRRNQPPDGSGRTLDILLRGEPVDPRDSRKGRMGRAWCEATVRRLGPVEPSKLTSEDQLHLDRARKLLGRIAAAEAERDRLNAAQAAWRQQLTALAARLLDWRTWKPVFG